MNRQATVIAILSHMHVIRPTLTYTQDEVSAGLNVRAATPHLSSLCCALTRATAPLMWLLHGCVAAVVRRQDFMLCIEMFVASVAHHRCYSFQVSFPGSGSAVPPCVHHSVHCIHHILQAPFIAFFASNGMGKPGP